jgi:hypothetical protein
MLRKRGGALSPVLFLLLFWLWIISGQAAAATNATWSLGGDGVWNNPAYWDIGMVPNGKYNAFIIDGTSTVTSNINVAVENLTLASGNGLIVQDGTSFSISAGQGSSPTTGRSGSPETGLTPGFMSAAPM